MLFFLRRLADQLRALLIGQRRDVARREADLLVARIDLDDPRAHRVANLEGDRKSTRLNSSHSQISYAVFCLKKKNNARNLPANEIEKENTVFTIRVIGQTFQCPKRS